MCFLFTKDTKRHEENHVFFIHEGHERHEENHVFFIHEGHGEKILRKIGRDRLPRLHGRCGAVVMG